MNIFLRLKLKIRNILINLTHGDLRIILFRLTGMKIGKNCRIEATNISTEPYLIEIGNHVAIASGVTFITHDGSVWVMRDKVPEIDIFGKIKIGDNTFIGSNSLILPGTIIGSNCIIGAGSVVRGNIPDNNVVFGNPAKIVFKTSMHKILLSNHKHKLMTKKFGVRKKKKILQKHFNIGYK